MYIFGFLFILAACFQIHVPISCLIFFSHQHYIVVFSSICFRTNRQTEKLNKTHSHSQTNFNAPSLILFWLANRVAYSSDTSLAISHHHRSLSQLSHCFSTPHRAFQAHKHTHRYTHTCFWFKHYNSLVHIRNERNVFILNIVSSIVVQPLDVYWYFVIVPSGNR